MMTSHLFLQSIVLSSEDDISSLLPYFVWDLRAGRCHSFDKVFNYLVAGLIAGLVNLLQFGLGVLVGIVFCFLVAARLLRPYQQAVEHGGGITNF